MKSIKKMLAVFALTSLLATGALAGDTPCGVNGDVKPKSGSGSSENASSESYITSMLGYATFFLFRF